MKFFTSRPKGKVFPRVVKMFRREGAAENLYNQPTSTSQPTVCVNTGFDFLPAPLQNFGNTCWVNSAVQLLQPVVRFWRSKADDVVLQLLLSTRNMQEYKQSLQIAMRESGDLFAGRVIGQQSDAASLVHSIIAYLRESHANFLSPITYQCEWRTLCEKCEYDEREISSQDIAVISPVLSNVSPLEIWQNGTAVYCPNCGTQGHLIPRLLTAPMFLVVRILNPIYETELFFHETLNVNGSNEKYNLTGFLHHRGSNTSVGHYTAVVKNMSVWFHCDDAYIEELPRGPPVVAQRVGIMIYEKDLYYNEYNESI